MLSTLLLSGTLVSIPCGEPTKGLEHVRRLVVLGDSITYAGGYVADLETYLKLYHPEIHLTVLNLGLPSETASGLSEPGHAGGAFPRPDLAERLDRVLDRTEPDLVLACYGMNDGIYHPLSEDRFAAYRKGIEHLRAHVQASGARIVHLTPPVFDPMPIHERTLPAGLIEYPRPFENYDEVLEHYAEWLLGKRSEGWEVIDIHGPLADHLTRERERVPEFRLAEDGIHLDATGHWLIARTILSEWKLLNPDDAESTSIESAMGDDPFARQILKLVRRRQAIIKDALLDACGHNRPGMTRGAPLEKAESDAGQIDSEIRRLIANRDESRESSPNP